MLPSQKPFRGVRLNKTHPLSKGLVGCWLFNEMTGETVFDSSGHGNTGTLENGVAWGSDGLEFDGVDDYVTTTETAFPSGNTDRTIIVWINSNDVSVSKMIIYHGTNAAGQQIGVYLGEDGSGIISIGWSTHRTGTVSPVVSNNEWTMIALVISGTTTDISNHKIYVNGVEKTLETKAGTVQTLNTVLTGTTYFGVRSTLDTYLNGSVAFVPIYDCALSTEEIAWLYREPYAMFEPAFSLGALYAALPPALKPMWYYNMLKRRNR